MTMPYWDVRLNQWARWKVAHVRGEVGWPKTSPMFMDMPRGDAYGPREPEFNEEAHFTDQCVSRLADADRQVIAEFYCIGGKGEAIAQRLKIAKATLYRRLDAIHHALMGHANDIAAGVAQSVTLSRLPVESAL